MFRATVRSLALLTAVAAVAAGPSAVANASEEAAVSSTDRIATRAGGEIAGGECGSTYSLVGFYPRQNDITDELEGHMEIYYSSTLKRNCAIMRHAGHMWGKSTSFPTGTFVEIRASGGSWQNCSFGQHKTQCDRGGYSFYAGPVYTPSGVNMSGRCIDFNGNVGLQTHIERRNKHCG